MTCGNAIRSLVFVAIWSNGISQPLPEQLNQLIGTWQVEGRQQFEEWKANTSGGLVGRMYRIADGDTLVSEVIRLYERNDEIIYEATVADQNDGASIPFVLNPTIDSCWSFENMAHDFPKKIQYTLQSESVLLIRVRGDNNSGFTFRLEKQ